jgi:RNA polymerase sigma factor for flagellar operon FliA
VEVLGHAPTTKEISDHFGILLEDAERIKSAGNTPIVRFCRMIPGGKDQQEDNNHSGIMDSNAIADPNSLCPEDELSKDVGFQELISCLSNVERIVVTLYHRDEYEMRKIGKILGMSESRVSQIRSTALQRIKDSLVL